MNLTVSRLALLLALLLGTSALACSTKAGYMANGLLRTPRGVTSTCGVLYKSMQESMGTDAKWFELFFVTPAAYKTIVQKLDGAIKANKYTVASQDESMSDTGVVGKVRAYVNLDSGVALGLLYGKLGSQNFVALFAK